MAFLPVRITNQVQLRTQRLPGVLLPAIHSVELFYITDQMFLTKVD